MLVAALVFVLVAGGIGAALAIFLKLRGTGDVLAKLTPDDAAIYATMYLDPSSSQKSNLNNLLHRFPDVTNDQQRDRRVDDALDDALRSSHLNHGDVRSWLGSQVALIGGADLLTSIGGRGGRRGSLPTFSLTADTSRSAPPIAVLIDSHDDGRARATLEALRTGPEGGHYDWSDGNHDGVPVATGTPREPRGSGMVYAVVDHAVVVAPTESIVDEVIDTAHGRHPSLDSNDRYRRAIAPLPGERLALAYADLGALARQVQDQLRSFLGNSPSVVPAEALQGFALSLSVQSTGAALDGAMRVDPSRLSEQQRKAFKGTTVSGSTLDLVPSNAYGFLAVSGINRSAQALLDVLQPSAAMRRDLDEMGITGPQGILPHLTGDAGVELQPRPDSRLPGGAVLLATDDEAAMGRFLGTVADATAEGLSSAPPPPAVTAPAPGRRAPAPDRRVPAPDRSVHHSTTSYRGVTITTASVADLDPHELLPSFAVTHGVGILGSGPDQVKSVIDAQQGAGITSTSAYRDAIGGDARQSGGVLFVDARAVVSAVRAALSPSEQRQFDREAAPYLAPLRSLSLTSHSSQDQSTMRLFIGIG